MRCKPHSNRVPWLLGLVLTLGACDDSFPQEDGASDAAGFSVQLLTEDLHTGDDVELELQVDRNGSAVANADCEASHEPSDQVSDDGHADDGHMDDPHDDAHPWGPHDDGTGTHADMKPTQTEGIYRIHTSFNEAGTHHLHVSCRAGGDTFSRDFDLDVQTAAENEHAEEDSHED